MQLIGAVLVFLSGASLGALVFLCLRLSSALGASARRAAWREQQTEELHARLLALIERQHRERLDHDDALGTILVDHIRLAATGLAAEIHDAAVAHRNDLRLASALPPMRDAGRNVGSPSPSGGRITPPPRRVSGPLPPPVPPPPPAPRFPVSERSNTPVSGLPAIRPAPLDDSEPTPPSGWG